MICDPLKNYFISPSKKRTNMYFLPCKNIQYHIIGVKSLNCAYAMSVEHMMHSQSPMNSIWWSNIRWFIEHSLTLRCDLYDLCGRVRESVLWFVRQWFFMIQISLLDTIHQVSEWFLFDIDSLQSLAIHWQFSKGPL